MYKLIARDKKDLYNKDRQILVVGEEMSIWNIWFNLKDSKKFEIKIYDLENNMLYKPGPFPMQPFRDEKEIDIFYDDI